MINKEIEPNKTIAMNAKEKEMTERIMFAELVVSQVLGKMDETLKGAPVGVCEELGRIWDCHCNIPVGVLFQRPKFEEYEAINKAAIGGVN